MRLNYLEKNIVSTLVYHDALGEYPLTAFEVYKYQSKSKRQKAKGKKQKVKSKRHMRRDSPNFSDLLSALKRLGKREVIKSKNGFYFLSSFAKASEDKKNKDIVSQRIERQKIAERKWKKLRKYVKLFELLPFIKMVAASGSIAFDNTREESDLDILIITRKGRIWMTRILCSFLTHIMGIRRYNKKIRDRICLNYYLAHDSLEIRIKNLSNAHTYAQTIPLIGKDWWEKFQKSNFWIKKYLIFYPFETAYYFRILSESKFLKGLSKILEIILASKIGDIIEVNFKKYQKEKVLKKIKQEDIGGEYLSLSDSVLMFHHPVSRNVEVEEKYKNALKLILNGYPNN